MARVKLTRDLIRQYEPAEKAYEIRDSEVRGLILRVNPSGRMVWVLQYARGKRLNLARADATTPSDARVMATKVLGDVAKGIDPMEDRRSQKALTLREYLDDVYAPWVRAHHADQRVSKAKPDGDPPAVSRIKANFPDLLGKKLDAITAWDIQKWRTAQLNAKKAKTTVNRQLNPLKAALNRAVEFGVLTDNPLASGKVKQLKVDSSPRVRYLSDDEERRLRDALDTRESHMRDARESANRWRSERGYDLLPDLTDGYADHLKPLVLLTLNTGLRRGEAFNLKWPDIDLRGTIPTLTIEGGGAKTGQTRHVPLNDEAVDVLTTWQHTTADSAYVFPGETGGRMTSVRTAWTKLLKDAGIANFRWHDMRHDFASKLVMAGVDLNYVRELLGHKDPKMTTRYAHLSPEVKRDAVQRLVRKTADVVPISEHA